MNALHSLALPLGLIGLLFLPVSCTPTSRGDDDTAADDDDDNDDVGNDDDTGADDDDDASPDDDDASGDDDTANDDDTATLPPTVTITSPEPNAVFELGGGVELTATVDDPADDPSTLQAQWSADTLGVFANSTPDGDGLVATPGIAFPVGNNNISLQVTNSAGLSATDTTDIGICTYGEPDTFDADLSGGVWQIYGDASWDAGGWLEMTGNVQDRKGAIFNLVDTVLPGDVAISFSIRTGPNSGTGADGFAMSVINALDVPELETLIADSAQGGGLGYGYGGDWGIHDTVEGFHVEIDTWHNVYNGTNEFHTDPTTENHIAVCMNGDPGDCPLFSAVPSIEDSAWHQVQVEVTGSFVTVLLDGLEVIAADVPGLSFRGGYIGFSGSTGFYTNLHSFDDLQILEECLVP